ncbi:GNAT family N-acetyltransferase [Paenarthrobacter sp. PH39-S1]|uniref:GNAT family N-acetyltransferase n=1 Tax=Paenarthrobacter sp. PH39-S1 TaxID=3046204 RepID=UPI0024B95555|nr:GNAT family N-acetyltransferase [Paenarthrobacter sp. PH39-S1]MDJ0355381.1 GNAT family N-acetyltransferase [Paenarthrobacter sp. PH39-S1]
MSLIRAAVPADVPAILSLIHELALYEKEPHAVRNTEEMLMRTLFGDNPRIFAHVAEDDGANADSAIGDGARGVGEVQGFALWFLNYSTWEGVHGIYLEDLYVRPDSRGSGHGKALLRTLAGIAVDRGYARVEWSVLDWNEPSIRFYKSLGATPMDGWSVFRLSGNALAGFGSASAVPASVDCLSVGGLSVDSRADSL